jgi:DNA-binding MarR family transcriptional regulator
LSAQATLLKRNVSSQAVTSKRDSVLTEAWVRFLRGHASVTRALSARLVADHGLTLNDYEALLHLSRAEGQSMRRVDLAEGLLLTASGVTRLLDGLEGAGLVAKARCQRDGRVTYAVLTRAGRAKLEAASCGHIASVRALFQERYTRDELETLAELLGRLPGAAGPADSCSAD